MRNITHPVMIRHASIEDWAAANSIHRAAYPDEKYVYANNIGRLGTINLVAVSDEQIVGFISVLVNLPNPNGANLWERMRPYIGFLGVSDERRRSGVGSSLVLEASRISLLMTGKDFIYLECDDENDKARKLYEKLGFKPMDSDEVEIVFGRPPHAKTTVYRGEKNLFEK